MSPQEREEMFARMHKQQHDMYIATMLGMAPLARFPVGGIAAFGIGLGLFSVILVLLFR